MDEYLVQRGVLFRVLRAREEESWRIASAVAVRERAVIMDLERFVTEARRYCDFICRASTLPLTERLFAAQHRLVCLYAAALNLPPLPEADDTTADSVSRPGSWAGFDDHEYYWEVFDPYELGEPVCGSLSDDLLDIYRDLRGGLDLWERGHKLGALWHWRFNFEIHWGDHCIDAMRALHRACLRTT